MTSGLVNEDVRMSRTSLLPDGTLLIACNDAFDIIQLLLVAIDSFAVAECILLFESQSIHVRQKPHGFVL